MAKSKTIACIDIGTTKIACFIAQVNEDEKLEIIGVGHRLAEGIRAGAITNLRLAENTIINAVHQAEKMAGINVDKVFLSISCGFPMTLSTQTTIPINLRVTSKDIKKVIALSHKQLTVDNRQILHTIPISYAIDGEGGIAEPLDMEGSQLTANIALITCSSVALKNIINCINHCQLEVVDYIISSHAAGLACLSDDERELGTTLIEIGGGVTGISVFKNGKNIFTDSIPIGGSHITSDIAKCLSTSFETAERIKALYGATDLPTAQAQQMIEMPVRQEASMFMNSDEVPISRSVLSSIIKPRAEEILEMVKSKLRQKNILQEMGGNIVLSGGGSQLEGIKDLCKQIIGKTTRLAKPVEITGMAESHINPAFSAVSGAVKYFTEIGNQYKDVDDYLYYNQPSMGFDIGNPKTAFGAVITWIRKNF